MPPTGAPGLRRLLAEPSIRRLWLAGVAAGIVRWLEILVFSLWVFGETGSALAVTLIACARMLPLLLLGAVAGAIADRFDRRRLLTFWFAAMALAALLLAALAAVDRLGVPLLAAYTLLTGLFWTFEMPVRRTMLAEAAGMARVHTSMSLEMTSTQATRLVGPLVGGWLVAWAGLAGVLGLVAVLNLAGGLLLAGAAAGAASPPRAEPLLRRLREGLGYVARTPLILAVVVSTGLFNLWYMPYLALAPVVAETTMRLTPGPIGVLMAAEGIGAVVGALWVGACARPAWFAVVYAAGATLIAASVLGFAALGEPLAGFVLLLAGGFGMACFATMQTSLILIVAAPEMRVRAMSVMVLAIGTAPIGFLLAGLLADALGARLALGLLAGCGVLAMLVCAVIWRELRSFGAPAVETSR
jgi:MFS family permease